MGFLGSSIGKESACNTGNQRDGHDWVTLLHFWFNSWVRKILWRRDRLPTPVFSGFPCGSAGKESACNVGDLGLIPGLGRSPGEGKDYPLQYSGLENCMDSIVSPWGPKELDMTEQSLVRHYSLSHHPTLFYQNTYIYIYIFFLLICCIFTGI